MKKATVFWLIAAAALVLTGSLLFAGVMATLNWDFHRLSTATYETNTYKLRESFDSILLDTDTADIAFFLSDDGICTVECYEEDTAMHSVTVTEGTLTVQVSEERTAQDVLGSVGIHLDTPKIRIFLPEAEYASLLIRGRTGDIEIPKDLTFREGELSLSTGDVVCRASVSGMLKIQTSTGSIRVENISAGALDLSASTGGVTASGVTCGGDVTVGVTTGKASLTDIACKNLISTGNTGDISLTNVIAAEHFRIERSTGDVRFEDCDAAGLFIETSTGDVRGTLLSDKIFTAETDTGSVEVPLSAAGGQCRIICSTGDIIISVKP